MLLLTANPVTPLLRCPQALYYHTVILYHHNKKDPIHTIPGVITSFFFTYVLPSPRAHHKSSPFHAHTQPASLTPHTCSRPTHLHTWKRLNPYPGPLQPSQPTEPCPSSSPGTTHPGTRSCGCPCHISGTVGTQNTCRQHNRNTYRVLI